ncbi:MAG: hypothetical protein DI565_09610 [Ancylobacter novellus]|uniref:Uncharacterized protein n=1 Tax=Ancylobacter novellus TaxID=921 RepID=A0A2W5KM95_ANCNO|nr:MAG: hypothetical protein DI565_09610 [Ancylobacter novellus]
MIGDGAFGLVELVASFSLILGLLGWQWVSIRRTLRRDRDLSKRPRRLRPLPLAGRVRVGVVQNRASNADTTPLRPFRPLRSHPHPRPLPARGRGEEQPTRFHGATARRPIRRARNRGFDRGATPTSPLPAGERSARSAG